MLEIRDLTKAYRGPGAGRVVALERVSLRLEGGDFVAVCGPSGSGKTTLLLAAGGLLIPDDGRVLVDGTDIYALTSGERAALRARAIGFVFQQFHLIPYLNVLDNVMAASLALGDGDSRERALDLVRRFGLEDRADHVPSELSTGEKQRTALARALLNRPRLILADEPTGNLDTENGRLVLEHLADFARSGGSVLLASHDPEAAAFAGRTVRLEKGRPAPEAAADGKPR